MAEETKKNDVRENSDKLSIKRPEITIEERQQEFLEERIPFMAFKDSGRYKDDLVVIVNGKTWQIQRGITVMIPRYVYLALKQSERQKAAAAKHSQGLIDQYRSRESGLA